MQKPPNIKDVAALAGVSVGTVSRVLANEAAVKVHLKEKVDSAIVDLGFRPNIAARALRTNQTDVIGFIIPDITNPFFAQLAKSVEAEADQRRHTVMLANSHNDAGVELRHIKAFLDRSVRGIIIVAASDHEPFNLNTDVPIVSLDRRFAGFPLIATNHASGAALIADHLYALGHRRIAYIAGPQNTEVGRARCQGFVTRIDQLDTRQDPVQLTVLAGLFDYETGEKNARELLTVPAAKRPTAIAAASDQQAIGALRVARDLKLDVPGDLSIAGFDDIALADLVVPRLTTVRQPTAMLARRAMELVFTSTKQGVEVLVEGELIGRDSTRAPTPLAA
jgi:LacI family transcriptional regulator